MAFFIGLLTFVMILDCLVLVLLVLIQLPKKEAGAGVAFGGAATDALFGAGSGNVLTKATKYTAATFFALALVLSVMQSHLFHRSTSTFQQNVNEQQSQPASSETPAPSAETNAPVAPAAAVPAAGTGSNFQLSVPSNATSSVPVIVPTNGAGAAPPAK